MKDKSKFNSSIALLLRTHPEFGALVGLVLVFVVFCFTATRFLSLESLAGIVTVASELGIVAAGITFLMITGEFDLSVGSTFGVSAMTLAITANAGIPLWIGFLLALAAAFL